MIDNHIIAGAQRQAELEAAKAAFFASGGRVVELQGFNYKPRPPKAAGSDQIFSIKSEAQKKRAAEARRIAEIREMSKTMTQAEVMEATGLSRKQLFKLSEKYGIAFQSAKAREHEECRRRREALSGFVRYCAEDQGMNRTDTAEALGVSRTLISTIQKEFDIKFQAAQ